MTQSFTREEFYDLVWSKPMTHLAKEFRLSDVALHKICKKHGIPKPQRYHYDSHAQLTAHLHDFIDAYNYGRRLKTLRGLTPYEYICKCWSNEPERFSLDPHHQRPGPNS